MHGNSPKKKGNPRNLSCLHLDRLRSREKKEIKCRGNVPLIYGLPWGGGGRRRRPKGIGKPREERKKIREREEKRTHFILPRTLKTFFFAQCVFSVFFSPIAIVPKIQFAFFASPVFPPPFLIKTNPFFPIQPTFPFFVSCRLGKWEEGALQSPPPKRRKEEE